MNEAVTQAPAVAPPLTIDTKDLREFWLPYELDQRRALIRMEALTKAACGRSHHAMSASAQSRADADFYALNHATCALEREWKKTVECIRDIGGLPLIIFPPAKAAANPKRRA